MSSQSGSQFVEYDSECYQVECIRESKIVKGKKMYLVKWKGWDQKDNTWEPLQNLKTVLSLVHQFQKRTAPQKRDSSNTTNIKQNVASEASKKTKIIQKQKKKKKVQPQNEDFQSQDNVIEIVESKDKKAKVQEKKESKKLSNINEGSLQKQRQLLKQKLKQQQRLKTSKEQKQKQKSKQKTISIKKNQSIPNVNTKSSDSFSSVPVTKQPSKPSQQNQYGDVIQITRINYHIFIPPQHHHLPAKLFYNVDRRNKITKKPVAVIDVSSDEIVQKNPQMVVNYLQNFVKEVEYYSYQVKNHENLKNSYQGL